MVRGMKRKREEKSGRGANGWNLKKGRQGGEDKTDREEIEKAVN